MRLFIAISLSEEIKRQVEEILRGLSQATQDEKMTIKWVKPKQYHLTLKFLGECPEERIQEIAQALHGVTSMATPFQVKIGRLTCLPVRGAVRVIALDVCEGNAPLENLAAQIEEACDAMGFPKRDHPFRAHMTLGRVKEPKNSAKLRTLVDALPPNQIPEFPVDSVKLIHSILAPQGPTYKVLNSFKLQQD
jgi:2'-5' RNA ligase